MLGLFSLEVWDRKKAIPPRNNVLSISYLVNIDGQIWLAILLAFESLLRLYVKFFCLQITPKIFFPHKTCLDSGLFFWQRQS